MLVERVLSFVSGRPADEVRRVEQRLGEVLDRAGQDAVDALMGRLATTGAEWSFYPADALAQRIQEAVAEVSLPPGSTMSGIAELAAVRDRPIVFLPNHLSYSDANVFALLLRRSGFDDIADRLSVIVGPKVYSDPVRRFFSLYFGTVKTPQSSARSSEDAVMSARDVAKLARETIATAYDRQAKGDALVVFVEGTRSRSGAMQRALPAVARYLEHPGAVLVPVGICGSEEFVPVDDLRAHATSVSVALGRPAEAARLETETHGNRRHMMDAVGVAIARLLPPEYGGVYADGDATLDDARAVANTVFGSATGAQR